MMLDRQSTTVPNTSNVSALTSMMVMSFPWARVPNATLHVTSSPGMRWLVPVLFVLIEPSPAAADDAAVWELLRGGGQVVLMRHAGDDARRGRSGRLPAGRLRDPAQPHRRGPRRRQARRLRVPGARDSPEPRALEPVVSLSGDRARVRPRRGVVAALESLRQPRARGGAGAGPRGDRRAPADGREPLRGRGTPRAVTPRGSRRTALAGDADGRLDTAPRCRDSLRTLDRVREHRNPDEGPPRARRCKLFDVARAEGC